MSFAPDSPLVSAVCPSPNHGERAGGRRPDMLILHYTGMPVAEAALSWLCSAQSRVSAHYFVHEDGRIVQLVPEACRAWHAGVSFWAGETDINSCSIGIEVANAGHDGGCPDFPGAQMAALAELCADIVARHAIAPERVLAHSDIAPARKQDPGEAFDWTVLASKGVGLRVKPAPLADGPVLKPGDSGDAVRRMQEHLAAIGYGVPVSGEFDAATQQAVAAFQRRYRREKVDGCLDVSTVNTINELFYAVKRNDI